MFKGFFFQIRRNKDVLPKAFAGLAVVIFVVAMITHPAIILEGSVAGLKAWWNIVFPSLLPFFILSELLMSFGVVHLMGILLEPVMRPLFNVPGAGSFVMAIGFTSGYPIGSMVTARLRQQELCTRLEAERLMTFTNNSSPLFMLVAVAVGMFNNPTAGLIIAGAHYLGNLTLGLALRFYGRHDREKTVNNHYPWRQTPGLALREMLTVLRKEQRPVGKIMGDAVKNSVNNLLNIGGFIILFAVLIRLLKELGIISFMALLLGKVLVPLGVSPEVLEAVASGFFEMTMGAKLASEAGASLLQQLVAVAIILSWSGISVIAQVSSMISQTDMRLGLFISARILHALLAAVYTVAIYNLIQPRLVTVIAHTPPVAPGWVAIFACVKLCILSFFALVAGLMLISLLIRIIAGSARFLTRIF